MFESTTLAELAGCAAKFRGKKISFRAPSFIKYGVAGFSNTPMDYPAISVTGRACSLDCEHCGGRLLESMIPAPAPRKLIEVCRRIEAEGAKGCLVSGGADERGRVPLKRFLKALRQVKQETSLTLAVHTGLIEPDVAEGLGEAGVDVALVDVIGDRETIERVYHINAEPGDFLASMRSLKAAGVRVAPHAVVGLNYGKITGEFHAIEMIKEVKPEAVVLVGLMPLKATRMESANPPAVEDFAKIIAVARIMMPETPLILGCARDRKSKRRLDVLAVECGVDAIAHPSEAAIERARELGLDIDFSPTCCAELALTLE